jgi:hypothetical protein
VHLVGGKRGTEGLRGWGGKTQKGLGCFFSWRYCLFGNIKKNVGFFGLKSMLKILLQEERSPNNNIFLFIYDKDTNTDMQFYPEYCKNNSLPTKNTLEFSFTKLARGVMIQLISLLSNANLVILYDWFFCICTPFCFLHQLIKYANYIGIIIQTSSTRTFIYNNTYTHAHSLIYHFSL